MLRWQFPCHVLKALFFIKIDLKLSYICKKMQNLRALGAKPPDPSASGGWELCPQAPQTAPRLRISGSRLNMVSKQNYPTIVLFLNNNSYIFQKSISGRVDRASVTEAVDSSSIPGRVKPKTIKIGIHSFPA